MANYLAQFQSIKSTCDRIVIAVEDVSDLWPTIQSGFEEQLPFKRACLNNKTRNPVFVEKLPAEFILTTDARLRSRFPQEQLLFWFREPYATVVLVTCEDLDEFKTILKPRLKLITQNDEREWFIVFVSKAHPNNDQANKMAKKVFAKLEVDFNSKKRERCCKFDIHGPEPNFWEDLESKVMESIRNTLDRRVQFFEDEIRKLSELRFMPVWNFCNFFILKESLAFMFEMAHLHEDALREYDELELCYLETVNMNGKHKEFGGVERGDDEAALLNPGNKALTEIVQDDSFREFEFRQYLFACQSKLLFKLNRPFEVASRGYPFIISFSKALAQHELILQATPRVKHFGIHRKPLPLEPSVLLREANRRRASLSAGNMFEIFDGSGPDVSLRMSPSNKVQAVSMSRTNSSPGFESSIDRPMRLAEIFVASEHALRQTISNPNLLKSLSSVEEFEQKYLELTKGAANNYHCSWWKRHGVVLDGEIAAVCFKHGNYDQAAKSYEKVCALYSGEGWQDLLAEVLPNLAECQKILNDEAGYLLSCVRLLSLDKGLFSTKERQAFQSEVISLAYGEMKDPVPLDVSSLITFSGNPGPPLELCDGDPGTLSVTVWSGFPDDITVDTLSLTLMATYNADEGAKALNTSTATVLKAGRNTITVDLPPQKPGSYVLGALTGHIGRLRFRSHSFSKVGPADSDDFMSYEKPTRPILKVFNPRPLVDLAAAISSPLLINEAQWVGIIVQPIDYSLKGAILQIDTGPGLTIEESHFVEMESHIKLSNLENCHNIQKDCSLDINKDFERLHLHDGRIQLPDWASNLTSILWIPIRAINNSLARGSSSVCLGLEVGVASKRFFSHTEHLSNLIAALSELDIRKTKRRSCAFYAIRVLSYRSYFPLQVILHSQVNASLTIYDAWLDLQDGFVHTRQGDGRPTSGFFPLVISSSSKAGILFSICLGKTTPEAEVEAVRRDSLLNIQYGISGKRTIGAHPPVTAEATGAEDAREGLIFRSALVLQRPVLDPTLAIGFLALPSDGLRVGQLVSMKWRVERLKDFEENEASQRNDEVLYEVNANADNWMIAGRKRGYVSLPTKQGSRIVISILCVPLLAGYVRPPQLGLPGVEEANISCNPPGPHLICVLPPTLSSSFCIAA
ncbi:Trafficking protein particle complex II-specific subunit 130-like [Citrus sinensis]|uniref:Trafficking protein particle complex II-specific subunit 130-like n=1 Tax=Citrus sinensis TaxID=2711 RepID=A0ACB8NYB4_CITSI|nr:Trafficking protein particle complex II-specific subunit 130-like [Citrus sinensis]